MAEEILVPGAYTALNELVQIRLKMTTVGNTPVGAFKNGEPFTVFEVYPEAGGIVWGRISSNTGGGVSRYVALRVNNHPKARLEKAFADSPSDLTTVLAEIRDELRAINLTLKNR